MSGYNHDGTLYSATSGSQYYSHPYAPQGDPSQPLRSTSQGLPYLGTNGVENGPAHYAQSPYQPQSTPPPQSTTPPYYEPRRTTSDLAPIPAPVIKSEYAAPVFQTFQERKRAKEQALRAQAGQVYSPVRSSTPSQATPHDPSNGAHVLPRPPSRDMPPPIRTDQRPVQDQRPQSPIKLSPTVRPSSTRPLPSPIRTQTAPPEAGPSRPVPESPASPSLDRSDTISSVKSLDRGMGFGSPSKRPLPKPPVVVVASKSLDRGLPGIGMPAQPRPGDGYERRTGRRLPSTVTEMSEGSEGDLSGELGRMSLSRSNSPTKLDSPVKKGTTGLPLIVEPSMPTISIPTINEPSGPTTHEPSIPTIHEPSIPSINVPSIVEPSIPSIVLPSIVLPGINEPSSSQPATFQPLPSINIDEDEGGIAFGGLPTIAVSSFDAPVLPPTPSQPTITRIDPTSAIICTGCTDPIIGRIVSAMGQRFHPQCFMCGECGELLEHVSSYEFNGKPYCHLDYHDKFAHRCHHCKTPIVEPRFITLDDPILGQRYYHELHFFCSECGDPFLDPSRSSAPGTERTRASQPEEEETNAFVIQKGHPYCERCHLRLHKPKCKGCKLPIPDLAADAMGGKWHQECFVCESCGNGFANSLFFPQDGKAFCTECYGAMVS